MNLAAINGVCKERIIFKTFLVVVKACMSMMKMIMFLIFRVWLASLTEASVHPQKQCLSPQILRYVMFIVYWEKPKFKLKVGTVLVKWACNTRQCIESHNFWLNAYSFSFHLLYVCVLLKGSNFFIFPHDMNKLLILI